jgi:hypothetical protein
MRYTSSCAPCLSRGSGRQAALYRLLWSGLPQPCEASAWWPNALPGNSFQHCRSRQELVDCQLEVGEGPRRQPSTATERLHRAVAFGRVRIAVHQDPLLR